MKQRVLSWVALALLLAFPAAAQQGTTELRGRVIDAQGGVLPGVTVNVRNQETGMFRETVSGGDGSFIASGLVPGTYQVEAALQGFKKSSAGSASRSRQDGQHRRDDGGGIGRRDIT